MSGSMSVEAIKHDNVLTVANAAIKPYQNGKAVQILPSGSKSTKPVWVPIQVGLKGLERTEVTSGLSEGQQVILSTQAATNVGALVSGTTQ